MLYLHEVIILVVVALTSNPHLLINATVYLVPGVKFFRETRVTEPFLTSAGSTKTPPSLGPILIVVLSKIPTETSVHVSFAVVVVRDSVLMVLISTALGSENLDEFV
jgi:hypothetical protein